MRVKATKLGYYNLKRRKEGAEFAIKSNEEFSPRWMEKVEDDSTPKSKRKSQPVEETELDEAI